MARSKPSWASELSNSTYIVLASRIREGVPHVHARMATGHQVALLGDTGTGSGGGRKHAEPPTAACPRETGPRGAWPTLGGFDCQRKRLTKDAAPEHELRHAEPVLTFCSACSLTHVSTPLCLHAESHSTPTYLGRCVMENSLKVPVQTTRLVIPALSTCELLRGDICAYPVAPTHFMRSPETILTKAWDGKHAHVWVWPKSAPHPAISIERS